MKRSNPLLAAAVGLVVMALSFGRACAESPAPPWLEPSLSADARADAAVAAMTQAEKLQLVFGFFSTDASWMTSDVKHFVRPKEGLPYSAGYVPGIPRLGIPAQWETDAGLGVATQLSPTPRERTALPSGLATAATWNLDTAFAGGAMIGDEARRSGFNVQLAGGMDLVREPRNGRNFEYGGEDPLLAGLISGAEIRGVQSNHIISTMKHYAFNAQETNRNHIDAAIDDQAARQSDLLAFQIAYEMGRPGAVMCAYNRVNGVYSCENAWLLGQVLKTDWGFKGYVMSDWGAVHSTVEAANAGLDQESGWAFDKSPYFAAALAEAVNNGHISQQRLDDMAHRILWAMFANGLVDDPVRGDQSKTIDYAAHAQVSLSDAEEGLVLLKNGGLLPLAKSAKSIAVIGGHADFGVPSGGGSSQVYAAGARRFDSAAGPMVFYGSSPMKAIAARTSAKVVYDDGRNPDSAARAAHSADIAIVFVTQWTTEGLDAAGLELPDRQDALIDKVAKANRKTIVVLETGGPVIMPWLNRVGAVVEAWYPGSAGGEAIARVLAGEVNPSGRLPVTFPASLAQTPRPILDGDPKLDALDESHPHVDYRIEGAAVGYKWFDKKGLKPLFPFGWGLSYSTFATTGLEARVESKGAKVSVTVKNTGKVAGRTVVQIYAAPRADRGWEAPKRLAAFAKTELLPGQSRRLTLAIDPRLLATWDPASRTWNIEAGDYQIMTGDSASDITGATTVRLEHRRLDVRER
ncbi:glycoside hydrolase family 3 C-terminal domain-containing protein [Phenylobacterium montanum]|uniref:Glycoside hydrolase family 3 C-terminal domain-containing protein n=1 Tax=Phenylobacterium montanum TaxID=2823693 RepID=A0A975IXC9_9CAUL|nr:glycoside hydrolase family 3 C-terminal domain-containing protein [Caulobacter sp. S6]